MELLVATLAHTTADRDTDVLARIRLILDTVRNAQGLISALSYRSRDKNSYYLLFTTWDDEESWRKAHQRHNPQSLLLNSAAEVLTSYPEQWLMRYLWGYSRPAAVPTLATAQLVTIQTSQSDFVQQSWIKGLRQHVIEPTLAFAFLARAVDEESTFNKEMPNGGIATPFTTRHHQGTTLLGLFSWSREAEREEFYLNPHYQLLNNSISSIGVVRTLTLEPL